MRRVGLRRRRAVFAVAVGLLVATGCGADELSSSAPTTLRVEPTTTAPTTTTTSTTLRRTAAVRETFSVRMGESVSLPAVGLTVTFTAVVSDNRCRPGTQCIVAGEASISVAVVKDGGSPTTLTVAAPGSARSGKYTIEVVSLSFGQPRTANLRVT